MKTTGELRKNLADCFVEAKEWKLSGDALRGVIGCANQINISISTEVKARAQLLKEGVACETLGGMPLDGIDK